MTSTTPDSIPSTDSLSSRLLRRDAIRERLLADRRKRAEDRAAEAQSGGASKTSEVIR